MNTQSHPSSIVTEGTSGPGVSPSVARVNKARAALRGDAFGLLLMLLVQFAAGMFVNLFVQIPDVHPGSNSASDLGGTVQNTVWAITGSGAPSLIFHAAFGLLIVANSLRVIVEASRTERRGLMIAAAIGFLAVSAAAFNGARFLAFGQDVSSMLMSLGFALAATSYGWVLYALGALAAEPTKGAATPRSGLVG
jgi:hypothetical protein